MALQQNPRGPALCRLGPGAILSFAEAVPGRKKHFGEEMDLLDCVQGQYFRRGDRELVEFPDSASRMGRPGSPPRDERTLLPRGTAEIGSWGCRASLGYPGFANLPANSKQPLKPCTPHRALPCSTALPSTQGRHQNRDRPAGGLGGVSPAAAVRLRQYQRWEGAPSI